MVFYIDFYYDFIMILLKLCPLLMLLLMMGNCRYWAISQPFDYGMERTKGLIGKLIVAIWVLSLIISLPLCTIWRSEGRGHNGQVSTHTLPSTSHITLHHNFTPPLIGSLPPWNKCKYSASRLIVHQKWFLIKPIFFFFWSWTIGIILWRRGTNHQTYSIT